MLSVIVPAYNLENYIEECIRSICGQDYTDIEIIVIDDGSIDKTGDICDRLSTEDKRIRVIHQCNQGVLIARIRGISEAKGEWISFVDGDDCIEKDMYEVMMNNVADADLCTCAVIRETETGNRIVSDVFNEGIYGGEKLKQLIAKSIYDFDEEKQQRLTPWIYNKIYRKDLMREVADALRNCQMSYAEDSVMLYAYMLKCQSVYIGKNVSYRYRYRNDSAIHSRKEDILVDINHVYITLNKLFEKSEPELCLIEQLQKWIVIMTVYAFGHQMGFRDDICPIEFMIDAEAFSINRLAVYGAGKCGFDYITQLKRRGIEPVLWVDKNYKLYRAKGYAVDTPEELKKDDYDGVLIAVSRKEQAQEIEKNLIEMGIANEKIHWRKPVRLF